MGINQPDHAPRDQEPTLRPQNSVFEPPDRRHVDPHQAGWYNIGIAAAMIVLAILLVRATWFSSF